MSVHVCRAPQVCVQRVIQHCPVCECRRRFVIEDAAFWGLTFRCCGCGDSWSDMGELYPRPFRRGWRKDAIAHAKALWKAADTPREARAKRKRYWAAYDEVSS